MNYRLTNTWKHAVVMLLLGMFAWAFAFLRTSVPVIRLPLTAVGSA